MEEEYFLNNMQLTPIKILCKRCGVTEKQMESHHVWCKFMDNPHGNTFKDGQPNRYWLCFDCHKRLHQELVIPLLNKYARTLKKNGSEYWLWKQFTQNEKPMVIMAITESTIKWVEKKDGDTKTT